MWYKGIRILANHKCISIRELPFIVPGRHHPPIREMGEAQLPTQGFQKKTPVDPGF